MKGEYTPSEAELEILQVLWDCQPATVRQIHEALSKRKDVGYTTTLKQVQRLYEKGALSRRSSGRTHLYSTQHPEKEVKDGLLYRLRNAAFKGSAMDLVMHALGNSQPSEEELAMLEKFLEEQKSKNK